MSLRNAYAVYRGYRVPHLQLIEHRRWWFTFSGVLIVLSLLGMILSGFHFSIDFIGGAEIDYAPQRRSRPTADPSVLGDIRPDGGEIQSVAGGDQVSIRTDSCTDCRTTSNS